MDVASRYRDSGSAVAGWYGIPLNFEAFFSAELFLTDMGKYWSPALGREGISD